MNIEVRHVKTQAETALADIFAAAQAALPGNGDIGTLRSAAFDAFEAKGLPHRRVEAWRYTNLRNLLQEARPLAVPPDAAAKQRARAAGGMLGDLERRRLVLIDGSFAADQSDLAGMEDGLTIQSMAEALASGDPVVAAHLGKVVSTDEPTVALNTALMGDGVVIRIADDVAIERPLHLVFVTTADEPAAMFMRSLVVAGRNARAILIESYEGPDQSQYQVNTALELVVGEGARIDRVKIVREGMGAIHIASLLANIEARATFNDFSFTAGGAVVRNQMFVDFAGEAAVAGIAGANLLTDRQHSDTTLFINHMVRGCQSREVFKSVLDDESHAVFQGKITVRPGAQRTDARMMTRALLLSETAEADSKPELEIFADDVQCGHGSTAGALDEELKFYLMARGVPAKEAEALLIQAFIGETIEAVDHAGIKDALIEQTVRWLQARG